jgi:ATP-dependent Zn protease
LEVWSGARDGSVENEAGSFLIFDLGRASTLTDETFASYLEAVKENVEELDSANYVGTPLESGFSFYDSNKFLRYDATLDENEVGNSYESYLSSSYTVGTAYMNYEDKNNNWNWTFVDYNLSEVSVAADVEEDETEDEEEDTTTAPDESSIWLLASSISIAVILLFAVVSIIVRKFVVKARKNKGYQPTTVQSVAPARKVKAKKTEENEVKVEVKDENDPYND